MTEARKIELAAESTAWRTLVDAAEGDAAEAVKLSALHHPLLESAWAKRSKEKQRDATWAALLACRDMGPEEATELVAAFLARDPVRTLPKVAAIRPVHFVVADTGESAHPWPTNDQGRRLSGRLVWFLDAHGHIGQLSWPKVVERAKVSPKELVARVARLAVHDQIVAFRDGESVDVCELCGLRLVAPVHVDHVEPFDALLDDWVASVGGFEAAAATVSNPATADPEFLPEHRVAWSNWHRAHAVLRLTHARCNLKRPKGSDS